MCNNFTTVQQFHYQVQYSKNKGQIRNWVSKDHATQQLEIKKLIVVLVFDQLGSSIWSTIRIKSTFFQWFLSKVENLKAKFLLFD